MSNTPSDAEIIMLAVESGVSVRTGKGAVKLARAVLARWGDMKGAPLTDEQLAEMMRDTWGCASIAPRHALEFARAVERAHGIGIKGGQHGTE